MSLAEAGLLCIEWQFFELNGKEVSADQAFSRSWNLVLSIVGFIALHFIGNVYVMIKEHYRKKRERVPSTGEEERREANMSRSGGAIIVTEVEASE